MKKNYQVLKWTAEVREKELQCLEEVELLDNHDPAVEFESDSENEAYDFLEKESGLLHIHKFDSCGLKFAEVDEGRNKGVIHNETLFNKNNIKFLLLKKSGKYYKSYFEAEKHLKQDYEYLTGE